MKKYAIQMAVVAGGVLFAGLLMKNAPTLPLVGDAKNGFGG